MTADEVIRLSPERFLFGRGLNWGEPLQVKGFNTEDTETQRGLEGEETVRASVAVGEY